MDIECTEIKENHDCSLLSASIAELGPNAGSITWSGCMELAKEFRPITRSQAPEIRDYFQEFGAWDEEEIDSWTLQELNAMVIQEIANGIREMERYASYEMYHAAAEQGQASGQLFYGDDGKLYCSFTH